MRLSGEGDSQKRCSRRLRTPLPNEMTAGKGSGLGVRRSEPAALGPQLCLREVLARRDYIAAPTRQDHAANPLGDVPNGRRRLVIQEAVDRAIFLERLSGTVEVHAKPRQRSLK